MTLRLPFPYVGGKAASAHELEERFNAIQANFERLADEYPLGIEWQTQVPRARIWKNTTQSLATATWTKVTLSTISHEEGGADQVDLANDRLTCVTPGLYLLNANVAWAANATGIRSQLIGLNGGFPASVANTIAVEDIYPPSGVTTTAYPSPTTRRLAVGDYIELFAYQSSGGALDVIGVADRPDLVFLEWCWLSP